MRSALFGAARAALTEEDERSLRIVPAANLHLTLVFLGPVDRERVPSLVDGLDEVAGNPAPELVITGIGAFPSERQPRVLWAGVREHGERRLGALQREVVELCRRASIDPGADADRPYRPHLTLARSRAQRGRAGMPAGLAALELELPWRPDAVELIESRPGEGGPPSYPTVASVPLAGGSSGELGRRLDRPGGDS